MSEERTFDYFISRRKGFSYLTYQIIISKISIGDNEAKVETNKKWFYFIKGTPKTVSIDYKSITGVDVKTMFAFWDLLFSAIFFFAVVLSSDKWWLFTMVIFMLCSFGKNIEISRNGLPKIIIPVDGMGPAKELIKNICEDFKIKMTTIGGTVSEKTESTGTKKENFLDMLPFRTMVEERLSSEEIEANQTLKKIMPYINLIGLVATAIVSLVICNIWLY
jgi:hypothetical protein